MSIARIALLFGLAGGFAFTSGAVLAAGSAARDQQSGYKLQLEFIDGKTAKNRIGAGDDKTKITINWTDGKEIDDPVTVELNNLDRKNKLAEKCGVFPPPPTDYIAPLIIAIAIQS
jgi:hypothetical protein